LRQLICALWLWNSVLRLLPVVSPVINTNLFDGSTKSYDFVREHEIALSEVGYVPHKTEITVDYNEGDSKMVELHDGSFMQLHKLSSGWDPTNKTSAFIKMHDSRTKGEILTGLIYIDTESKDLHDVIKTCKTPLNKLTEKDLMPSIDALEAINADHR